MDILGVPVARLSLDEVEEFLADRLAGHSPCLVFTPNPEIIDRGRRDPEFSAALRTADLCVADGVGVLWASRILGAPLPGTVPGVELMERLLARCADVGAGVYFVGTTADNVRAAAQRAREKAPGLRVVGTHHGFFSVAEEHSLVCDLARRRPGLVLFGMGVPKDQVFATRWRDHLPPAVYLAVGGGLDVLAGAVHRAPGPMRRLGMEWLYRLITSPRRWRRQLALPRFATAVLLRRFAAGSDTDLQNEKNQTDGGEGL